MRLIDLLAPAMSHLCEVDAAHTHLVDANQATTDAVS